jgi:hypothetical protein
MNDGKGNHLPQTEEKDLWINKKNDLPLKKEKKKIAVSIMFLFAFIENG